MKHLFLFVLAVSAVQAQAMVFTCQFGNPFSEVAYDSKLQTLSIAESSTGKTLTKVISGVAMKDLTEGELSLVSSENKILVTMIRTDSGSDGTTNFIYPFSASAQIDENNQGAGACETDYFRAEKPEMTNSEEQ